MVTRMDADLGRMFALLKKLGLDDNTLVLFSSDNGPQKEGGNPPTFFESGGPPARHQAGPLRRRHSRAIARTLARNISSLVAVSDHIGYFGDFLATAAELAGVQVPSGLDSISFLPTLLGQTQNQKTHEYLYWEFHEGGFKQSIRMGNWKAVRLGVGSAARTVQLEVGPR